MQTPVIDIGGWRGSGVPEQGTDRLAVPAEQSSLGIVRFCVGGAGFEQENA